MKKFFGGIEAGGTKFVCAVGTGKEITRKTAFPTEAPEKTMHRAFSFFSDCGVEISSLGIGAFGPLDLRPSSPDYGKILFTPKRKWRNFNILESAKKNLGIPVFIETDVNAAAFGEFTAGAARGISDFLYFTIGTGIGGGGMSGGKLIKGQNHPEMGHIRMEPLIGDSYRGKCPFHANRCFEGLACGPAVEERWGEKPELMPPGHECWEMEAEYIARAMISFLYAFSPVKIILGGGVMARKELFPLIRKKVAKLLSGYALPEISAGLEEIIVPPGLGAEAGIRGTLFLAEKKYASL